ncbi:hypothetical protein ACFSFY_15400 [Sporosarcina siberiensis]|uniref:Group-specific protein n=1 Tax=Sporosarcina siberiensis TaxID=1365606 RepID=A0ABW4SLP6_9BACL
MSLALEIARIVLPLIVVGGIGVFVILRMKYKSKQGTLGKKQSKSAQNVLDSLIPFGMIVGCAIAVLINLFTSIPLLSTLTWGPGIGFLLGYVAYEIYSKMDESHSQ